MATRTSGANSTQNDGLDVGAVEAWLADPDATDASLDWQIDGLDLWPLFVTCLLNLAVLMRIRQPGRGVAIGSRSWQAGVVADTFVGAPLRRTWRAQKAPVMPEHRLDGRVFCHGSRLHFREMGSAQVAPPLDVPAILLRRAGHDVEYWIDDVEAADAVLGRVVGGPCQGGRQLMLAAQASAVRRGTLADLGRLEGFQDWAATGARLFGVSVRFFRVWLARQVNLALAYRAQYAGMFERAGTPSLVVIIGGGFANTVGVIAAAKARGVGVIEPQHGVESPAAVVRQRRRRHFSSYNTACDAFIAWDRAGPGDAAIITSGPSVLLLPEVVGQAHTRDRAVVAALSGELAVQRAHLDARAAAFGADREVLVSLQPGDDGKWAQEIAARAPAATLFWVRRHGADDGAEWRGIAADNIECDLARSVALPVLLSRVHAHVTRFSSVTLEAAALGVPTFALEPYAANLFRGQVDEKLFKVCDVAQCAAELSTVPAAGAPVAGRPAGSALADLSAFLSRRAGPRTHV